MKRTLVLAMMLGAAWSAQATQIVAPAPVKDDRPEPAELRLSEADVLARFTPEVRANVALRDRALALWRAHFSANAAALIERFRREPDWRPVLAEAAELVDDFLDASLLPRTGAWSAGDGMIWVETLDPATGERKRELRKAERPRPILAPTGRSKSSRPTLQSGEVTPRRDLGGRPASP